MYFVVILAFALLLSDALPPQTINLINGPHKLISVWGPTLLVASLCFILPLITALIARRRILKLQGAPECDDELVAECMVQWQVVILFLLGITFTCTMLMTPWAPMIKQPDSFSAASARIGILGLGRFPLIGDLVVLSPFLMGLLGSWIIFYPVELAMRSRALAHEKSSADPCPTTPLHVSIWSYLLDKCRHQFLIVAAPMFLIVTAKHYTDLLSMAYRGLNLGFRVGDAVLGVVSFAILLISPVMLRYIWATRPLPPGPLRERFERTCRRIGLRYREILLWQTHGMTVNAAVMGFIPAFRYVLISDALLDTMSDEEIEAVFGHEAGHIRHWHLPLFGVFAIVSMYAAGGALLLLQTIIRDPALLQLISLAVLLGMWLFGFGWLSRRFERQADLFGVRCVTPDVKTCVSECPVHGDRPAQGLCISAASLFGRTLIKIAELNGIPREAPSWRHGSIESRCRLLESFVSNAPGVRKFDRNLTVIKSLLMATAIVGTVIAAKLYYPGIARQLGLT